MAAFAAVSGDHNPIHTSIAAAKLAGLGSPIVHGMWLSAAAQHAVSAVDPESTRSRTDIDRLDRSVPRNGPARRARSMCVSTGSRVDAGSRDPRGVMPGRWRPGDGRHRPDRRAEDRRTPSPARASSARAWAWTPGRAPRRPARSGIAPTSTPARRSGSRSSLWCATTRPTSRRAGSNTATRDGVLHLTQFTQVAMATLGVAQVAELREAGAFVEGAMLAGHSVGEYNALAAVAGVLPLEAVLEVVFQRGSAMHELVPRDARAAATTGWPPSARRRSGCADADVDRLRLRNRHGAPGSSFRSST